MRYALLLLVLSTGILVGHQGTERWFSAGPPELLTSNTSLTPLLTWNDYSELTAKIHGPRFVLLTARPALSDDARFGVNFVLGGKNRSLAVDGSEAKGYRLFLDVDGNGQLTNDEALPMTKVSGKFTATFRSTVSDTTSGGPPETYPVEMTFALDTAIPPGGTSPIPVVRRCSTTVRRGVVQVSNANVQFALLGRAGIYNMPGSVVVFDLRGRGLDLNDERSPDRFEVSEGKVTIGATAYGFRVDRYGRGLALVAAEGPIAARPTLEVSSVAPDFALVDLDGGRHRLSDYRGRVVLLVFWAVWCGPCRAEAPKIAEVYRQFSDKGFVVLGVNPNDPVQEVRAFVDQFHVPGLITRQPMDEEAHKLYRISSWPANFLIGRDGRILANNIDATHLAEAVGEAVRSR